MDAAIRLLRLAFDDFASRLLKRHAPQHGAADGTYVLASFFSISGRGGARLRIFDRPICAPPAGEISYRRRRLGRTRRLGTGACMLDARAHARFISPPQLLLRRGARFGLFRAAKRLRGRFCRGHGARGGLTQAPVMHGGADGPIVKATIMRGDDAARGA